MNQQIANPVDEKELNDRFDQIVIDMLRRGKRTTILGGEVVEIDLTAADLNVIRQRLKDEKIKPKRPTDPIGEIVRQQKELGVRFQGTPHRSET